MLCVVACGPAGVPGAAWCVVGPRCLVCRWVAARPRAVRAASFARRVVSKPGQALPPPTGPAAWPSVPSGTLHTGGACVAVRGWARRLEARPGPAAAHGHRSLALRALHTGGACVAVTSPARPYRMGTAAWVSGLSTQWCPVADADWRVVSKPGQASPRPWAPQPGPPCPPAPSIPAVLVSLCVAGRVVSKLGQAPSPPMGTAAWPSGTLRTGGACVAVTSPARPCRRPRAPQSTGSTAWPSRSCGALHAGRANPLRGR